MGQRVHAQGGNFVVESNDESFSDSEADLEPIVEIVISHDLRDKDGDNEDQGKINALVGWGIFVLKIADNDSDEVLIEDSKHLGNKHEDDFVDNIATVGLH